MNGSSPSISVMKSLRRVEHPVALEDLALVRHVDRRQLELLGGDVLPHVELGPVGDRERADVLAGADARVVEVPQLRALAARVPLAEVVADGQHALLGARALLVAAGAAEAGVEPVLGDRVQQRHGLQAVARGPRAGLLAHAALVDRLLHGADEQRQADLRHQPVAELDHLGEVVARVHVQQRERHLARRERLLREPHEHDRVLAAAEQQRGALTLGRDLADDVDGLGLEGSQVRQRGGGDGGHTCNPHSVLVSPAHGPHGRIPGWCKARSRSTRSPGRAAGGRGGRVRRCDSTGPSRSTRRAGCTSRSPLVVELDGLRVRARRRLLAADAGDPRVRAGDRPLQRGDLALAAAVLRAGPGAARVLDLHVDAEALLERPPGGERLGEQHAGVDRDDAGVGRELDELVDEDRLLLLEGAEHHQAVAVALHGLGQHLGDGAHATGSSTGVSSCVHHSGSVRPAKSRNVSPSAWCVS